MTGVDVMLLISVLVVVDVVAVGAVLSLGGQAWRRFAARYPGQAELPGAQRRRRQRIAHGICNWGWCFTISRDVRHVHLEAGPLSGGFLGRQRASIPLEELIGGMPATLSHRSIPGGFVSVKLGIDTLRLPRWIFE